MVMPELLLTAPSAAAAHITHTFGYILRTQGILNTVILFKSLQLEEMASDLL